MHEQSKRLESTDANGNIIKPGDTVKIAPGAVGDGYRFQLSEIGVGGFGEEIVYGHNYGPVRASEVVSVHSGLAGQEGK